MTTNPTDFYDIYSLLNAVERETLTRWRAFLEGEVAWIANDACERGEFPLHLLPKLGALMADTLWRDQAYYPVARPQLWSMLTMEIERVDSSLSSFLVCIAGCARSRSGDLDTHPS